MVRVTKVARGSGYPNIHTENIDTKRKTIVWFPYWHKNFRPFVTPTEGTATTGGEK